MRGWTKASTRLFCQARKKNDISLELLHHTFHTQLSHLSYTFTPTSFYTRHLLHQPAFTRDTFYTNQLLHQTPFTIFHTRHPLHQTPLTRGNFLHHKSFYTRHLLHQTPFTPNTLYIYRLLHHTFHTKHLLHQAPFTLPQAGRPRWIRASDPNAPYQNCLVVQTTQNRHPKHLLFLPKTRHIFTRHLLPPVSTTPLPHTPSLFSLRSQGETTPSLPWTSISKQSGLYIRHIFIRHLWHPTPFTPDNFFTKHSLQQAPFTPNTL